jgi:outer membrane protein assembly factor BamE (lipoprotein component of BamABCDE complex)
MRKLITLLFMALFISGCAGSQAWYSVRLRETIVEANKNKTKMTKLRIGMTQEEVIEFMGQPFKTEAYSIDGKGYVFLFYRTSGWNSSTWPPIQDTDGQFTPLCFEINKLVGWGRNFYDQNIKFKSEIKQDINIHKE